MSIPQHQILLPVLNLPLKASDITLLIILAVAAAGYLINQSLKKTSNPTGIVPFGSRKNAEAGHTRNIVEKMKTADKNCVVFFGSQSGVAEDLAARVAKEGHSRFGLKTMVGNLEDYDYENLDEFSPDHVAIFVMATFGEGEPTDNAQDFYNFITDENVGFSQGGTASDNPLCNMQYVIFGLGNSTYEHFSAVSGKIDGTLESLGAQRLANTGRGDDGERTTEEDFLAWKEPMWASLVIVMNLEERESVYEPVFNVTERSDLTPQSEKVFLGEPNMIQLKGEMKGPFSSHNPFVAPIIDSQEIFREKDRNCMHIEISLAGSGLSYETGDHVSICPVNSGAETDRFLSVFGLLSKRDAVIDVKGIERTAKVSFPLPTTYDTVVRYRLEICAPVSRQFVHTLATFAPNEAAKAEMIKLGTDKDYFHYKVTGRHLNLAQTLEAVGGRNVWSTVPFSILIEGLLALQPRHYSISSSSLVHKDSLTITTKVESIQLGEPGLAFKGVTTNYLLALQQEQNGISSPDSFALTYATHGPRNSYDGTRVPLYIRPSTFRLPKDPTTPVIMVGPGTGVAPFRGFIQERAALARNGEKVGKTILFYGCRKQNEDFIYEADWKVKPTHPSIHHLQPHSQLPQNPHTDAQNQDAQAALGPNFTIITAFSRAGTKKHYVQDNLAAHAQEINGLLERDRAHFYCCGDASMAKDVMLLLEKLIAEQRGISASAAEDVVKGMRAENVYQEDAWS